MDQSLIDYQLKLILANNSIEVAYSKSDHENPSVYCSNMNNYAEELVKSKKGIIFFNEDFIYGMIGNPALLNEADFKKALEANKKQGVELKYKSQTSISLDKKRKVNNIYQFMIIHKFNVSTLNELFNSFKFTKI